MGGFGVVWLAEKRTAIATTQVALKLPRGEDIDLEAFKQEAAIWIQASGHPNVLPLIDADIYDEQVVIVSEYVPDGSLAGWLKQHRGSAPSAEVACEIMDGVLAGLAHLHARHIIHRDLKPENILLQRETPRLADFGIARLLKSSSHSAKVSGTLAYMAPEAFDGQRNEQTDVWSVGVIFYELLAGRLPYDQADVPSFIGAIMRHDAPPLPDSVPEVLRQIVTKALQRDHAKRYSSAAEMRRDLRESERLLWLKEREAREARPATAEASPATLVLNESGVKEPLAGLDVLKGTLPPQTGSKAAWAAERAGQQTFPSEGSPTHASVDFPREEDALPTRDPGKKNSHGLFWLTGAASAAVVAVVLIILVSAGAYLLISSRRRAAASTASYALKQTLAEHREGVIAIAFSPDGKSLASVSDDATAKLWDPQTGTLKQTLTGHVGHLLSVAFSPDGRTLVTGGHDKTIKLWDAQTGALKRTLTGNAGSVSSVAFSPDGKTLANGSMDKTVRLWDAQTWMLKHTLTGNTYTIWPIAFSPDGKTLVSGIADGTMRLWDPETGELRQTLTGHTGAVFSVAFSPDGKTLASGSVDGTLKLWEAQTGVLKQTLNGNSGYVMSVAFSPDGKTLASGSAGNTLKLWDAQTWTLRQTLTGHSGSVISVAFSPDGKTIASGSLDKTVKLWRVE